MAATHINITGYVLQPGARRVEEESGTVATESTYLGPADTPHGFVVGGTDPVTGGVITSITDSVVEGNLREVVIVARLGFAPGVETVISETVSSNRQYFSVAVPGYGYIQEFGAWVMVPTVTVHCVRPATGGYQPGSMPHSTSQAQSVVKTFKLRVKNIQENAQSPGTLVDCTVTIGPLSWYCSSASCHTSGGMQEIDETWEVSYGISYVVAGEHLV